MQSHADAQYLFGEIYKNGCGVDENNSTAVQCYREAGEQGISDAQDMLRWMYKNGLSVDKNILTAID